MPLSQIEEFFEGVSAKQTVLCNVVLGGNTEAFIVLHEELPAQCQLLF